MTDNKILRLVAL